jgi:alkanesulfonate monooxygenase SsuD/methylene tetrahydromethanopterin reductase-like flavin-dependent oxidoreductase (luciferase family)
LPEVDVGLALPQMTVGLDRDRILAWCRAVDDGPFSSISAGERITYDNLDGFTLCSAAAALTERVRVLVNAVILPWHAPALIATQLASMDVLSGGRLEVAVGVGVREQDFAAVGVPMEGRFGRLDRAVAEVRRLWEGGEAAGGGVVGPMPTQPGGPPILSTATHARSLARAAHWADGVSGFSLEADLAEVADAFRMTREAWAAAGRDELPRLLTGAYVCLGPDAEATLHAFAHRYLAVFGERAAAAMAARIPTSDEATIAAFLRGARDEGAQECILIPASGDLELVARLADLVTGL